MNIIKQRKTQLTILGIITLIVGFIMSAGGVVLLLTAGIGEKISIIKLVFGIILIVLGLAGLVIGLIFTWTSTAIKATDGSIAEDNLAKGTVNMHKCENCGEEVAEGVKLCEKCKENLKP